MNSPQLLVAFSALTTAAALWAAVFATRADRASRRALKQADARWEASTRPVPHLTFTAFTAPGQSIQVQVENLGGTLAAGALIVQSGDDLYAGEVTLPERSPARPFSLPFVVKAWQRAAQPRCLLFVARDVGGGCWNCLDGGRPIKDPRRWLGGRLRELRMQGMVEFPGVTAAVR